MDTGYCPGRGTSWTRHGIIQEQLPEPPRRRRRKDEPEDAPEPDGSAESTS